MPDEMITRRRFNQWLAAGLVSGCLPAASQAARLPLGANTDIRLKVAAVQMIPVLGDAEANLRQAEDLVRLAQRKGAQWIILPEMFTSAAAFHPDLLGAIRPVDGAPAQMMSNLARQGGSVVGGSFLAKRDGEVYNTFVLAFPDGTRLWHDKDFPTYWENCFYRRGADDGLLDTPLGTVGSVLCWEFIRSQTAQRLSGRVRMVVGGSCWWTLPDDADPDSPLRTANLKMLQDAAPRLARMLGVPVIHGSHAGRFNGFFSPDLPDVPYDSSYLGEAMIVDGAGNVLARRAESEGEGVVVAEITLPGQARGTESIPTRFWIPDEMPEPWKESWVRWFGKGEHYYRSVTKPFLETGEIMEYEPEYL